MENKYKVLKIMITVTVVIICILLISYFAIKKLKDRSGDVINTTPTDTTKVKIQKNIQEVTARDIYYIMKNISKKYFDYLVEYNAESYYSKLEGEVQITDEDRQGTYKIILDLLDNEYIKNNLE